MGIPGLPSFLQKQTAGKAVATLNFSEIKNMRGGIDTSLMVYQTEIGVRGAGYDLTNS
jgi:hypothetical protein